MNLSQIPFMIRYYCSWLVGFVGMYFITFAIKYGLQKLKQAKVLSDSICVLSEVDLHSYCRIRQTFGEKNRNENRALETAVKKIGTKFVSRQFVTNWCNLMWFPLVLIWEVETLQQNESTFVPSTITLYLEGYLFLMIYSPDTRYILRKISQRRVGVHKWRNPMLN